MVLLTDLLHRVRALLRRGQVERDLDEELAYHVDQLIAHHMQAGLPRLEAERLARLEFGGVNQVREAHRDARGTRVVEDVIRDLRYAMRQASRTPALTFALALSVGLAIGANSTIFGIVDDVLLRPLPFPEPERLVRIDGVFARLGLRLTETGIELAYPHRAPEVSEARAFEVVGSYTLGNANIGDTTPERVAVASVSPGFFSVLRATPRAGRAFTAADVDASDGLALVSENLWRRRFASGDVTTRTLSLNGRAFAVLGVMSDDVRLPAAVDVWIPEAADPQLAAHVSAPSFLARLAPGVTPDEARQELLELLQHNPLTRQDPRDASLAVTPLHDAMVHDQRSTLLFVATTGLLVYVVACLNAASLLLARLAGRTREFGIRRAIGASARRVARQVLCESVLLGGLGAAVAVPAAWFTRWAIAHLTPAGLVTTLPTVWSVRQIIVAGGLTVVTIIAFAIASYAATRRAPVGTLRVGAATTDGRQWTRAQHVLVTCQIAGGVAILVLAAALVRTVSALTHVEIGARHHSAVVAEVTLPRASYATTRDVRRFHETVRDVVRAQPGVTEAGATTHLPGDANQMLQSSLTMLEDADASGAPKADAYRLSATPGYFETLGIDIIAGRTFTDADRETTPRVTVVSEGVARALRVSPRDLLSRRLSLDVGGSPDFVEVVGVVRDVRMRGPESPAAATMYLPFAQWPVNATSSLVVRGPSSAQQLASALRTAVAQVDGTIPLYSVRTFDAVRDEYLATQRFTMTAMLAFGVLASGLAAVGLFGVLSYAVRLRAKEFGIRLALGATTAALHRDVLWGGSLRAGAGLLLGIGLAYSGWRVAAARVPGMDSIAAIDVLVSGAAVFALAILATWMPARRAARTDAIGVLRTD